MNKIKEIREYSFEFSVVMAVYNVEPFLREAVDSLIAQDFGFEHIQLIMVDDGSTDGSGAICDDYAAKYPENIMVIHKKNGGVASARNEGLKYAKGRYLNFMDSDDMFTKNVFSKVYDFFIDNEAETDLVTIPLEFFDAQHGAHWQNDKFNRGTRILDLYWDYKATIMYVNASFFVNHLKDEIEFDSHLVCGEDIKVLLQVLIHKMKLGVITGCKYMYRRRSYGEASLIQASKKKYGWYFDYFTYLVDWAVDFFNKKLGFLPAFVQYELVGDLQWRFGQIYDMTDVLTPEEIEQYKQRLFHSLRYFDDKYILEQKKIWAEHKCYMLSKKYECSPTLTERKSNVIVHFGDTKLTSFADQYSKVEFVNIKDNKFCIEGFVKVFGVDINTPLSVFLKVYDEINDNEYMIKCELVERELLNEYRFEELIFRGIAFKGELELCDNVKEYKVQIVLRYKNSDVVRRDIRYGKFSSIGSEYNNMYYYKNGWRVQAWKNAIFIRNISKGQIVKQEIKYLKELWRKNRVGAHKAVFARLLYRIVKKFKHKKIWLISDRFMMAGDNGEAFFRYLSMHKPENVKFYFILSKQSLDYKHMQEIGPVIEPLSFKHKFLHLLCDYNISSQFDDTSNNPFYGYHESYRDILSENKFIFLQHGVTKDDMSKWLNRYEQNITGFITAARPEYNSILNGEYYYNENQVWLSGFPRFDRLYNKEQKFITFMPTWRLNLLAEQDIKTDLRKPSVDFVNSEFVKYYRELLNNSQLLASAEKYGFELSFLPHPAVQPYIDVFDFNEKINCYGMGTAYRDIYAQSNLIVTDYSSAVFDFAYLRKPIIYSQFDKKSFFNNHTYQEGYFDYERDGFGEVEYDLDSTVNRIIEYMENNCQLKDKYRERIDKFFAFNDKNNCQRVYEAILALDK